MELDRRKLLILASFCTFRGKKIVACGGQGEQDAGAHRAVRALTKFYDEISWRLRKGTELADVDRAVRASLLFTEDEQGGSVYNLIDRLNDSALTQGPERQLAELEEGRVHLERGALDRLERVARLDGARPAARARRGEQGRASWQDLSTRQRQEMKAVVLLWADAANKGHEDKPWVSCMRMVKV